MPSYIHISAADKRRTYLLPLFAFQEIEHCSCKKAQDKCYKHSNANDHESKTTGIGSLDVRHAVYCIGSAILSEAWMEQWEPVSNHFATICGFSSGRLRSRQPLIPPAIERTFL